MNEQITTLLCKGRVAPYTLHHLRSTMKRTALDYSVTIGRDDHENVITGFGATPVKAARCAIKKWKEVAP